MLTRTMLLACHFQQLSNKSNKDSLHFHSYLFLIDLRSLTYRTFIGQTLGKPPTQMSSCRVQGRLESGKQTVSKDVSIHTPIIQKVDNNSLDWK